jgi:hypothetical protein
MADNVEITAGTGTTVAADEIAGVKHQRVKVEWGADGTANDTSAANPMPVVQTGALPAGTAIIGQTSIDQTTPGTTDSVTVKASAGIGSLTETAPATDTASSGLNGRLQRVAQRLTSLIALLPAALGAGGGLKVDGSGTALPVNGTVGASNFPATVDTNSGAKSASTLRTVHATDDTMIGALTETAPASDTASAGLNGRLQRLAQHLTTIEDRVYTLGEVSGSPTANTVADRLKTLLTGIILAAGEAHIGSVGGTTVPAAGTMTRTSDTNAYTAGDGVTTATSSASAMSVTGAARVAAGSGVIIGGRASKNATGTSNASFRLWIYQGTPSAIPNDNAAFTAAVHADYLTLVGTASFDFANGIVGSDGVEVPITLDRAQMGYKLASGTSLTVIWEARAAYAPASGEIFRLVLDTVQD